MDSRQLGRQTSTQVEWQAGRGWWYWGKEKFKHNRCLVIQTFTSAETGICHCSWYNDLAMSGWRTRGLSRAEMMTEDWWQMCKSDRCRAGENEETPCPRGGDSWASAGYSHGRSSSLPSMGASRRPTSYIRVLRMEISDQGCIKDVATGLPATLLRAITLPVPQVPVTPAPSVHVQQTPDSVGRVVIDDAGWWRGCHRGG